MAEDETNIPALQDKQKYHVFIIHNSETERDVSLQLHEDLTKRGYKCCHSDINFQPGSTIVTNILTTINETRRVVAIVSPQFLKSNWCKYELISTHVENNTRDRQILIPVLYNIELGDDILPSNIKSLTCLEFTDTCFWQKLTSAILLDVPLAASIPAGNVAHGLAWSYFYGFLNLVLPQLIERVKSSKYWNVQTEQQIGGKGVKMTVEQRIIPKLIIVIPESCYCPGTFSDIDENIVFDGHIPFKATRAGNVDRDYKNSVYKITHPDTKQVYYAVLEFATPVLSLYEMTQGAIAGLNTTDRNVQRLTFESKLKEILEHPNNRKCNGSALLLMYRDIPTEGAKHPDGPSLARVLIKLIRHEIEKEMELAPIYCQIKEAAEKLSQLDHTGGKIC